VIRQHEVRAVAHVQATFDIHAIAHQLVHLGEKRFRVQHHSVADRAAHTGMQDPTRHLVQHERFRAQVDCVPSVRASLVAHHPIGSLCHHVNELALTFVAPLGAYNHHSASL
jgi:hypothetical protein